MLEAKIQFFDINKFGFYLRGGERPVFGACSNTLENLNDWATDGRSFENTKCYEENNDSDILNTYFCGFDKNEITEDCVLVLWNEVANDNGVVYGMNPSSTPGDESMLTTDFGDVPAIPGAPSYFWFIPSINSFATIKFMHSVNGKGNLDRYLNGFMCNKSPCRVLNSDGSVVGFSPNGQETNNSSKVYSKFSAKRKTNKPLEAELLSNLEIITKVVKKEVLQYAVESHRTPLENMFRGILDSTPTLTQDRDIIHELQFKPSESQLRSMFQKYSDLDSDSTIKNIGFVYNNGRRVMLNSIDVNFTVDLIIQRESDKIISADRLLSAITRQREDILRHINTTESSDAPIMNLVSEEA